MPFNELFGGNTIYPSDPTFLNLALASDIVFQWPLEQNMVGPTVLAAEIEVTPGAAGHSVSMPDATRGSTGYTTTFYNAGADSFTIKDFAGNTLGVVTSGTAWTLWLRDNSTQAGLWRVFQLGAATSAANAAALAGAGLVAISTTLNEEMAASDHGADYALVDADRATIVRWTGGVGNLTLPDPATVGTDWFVAIKNSGSGIATILPTGVGVTIDGTAQIQLAPQDSTWLATNGSIWFSIGFGQSNPSVFDFLSMSAAGTGDLVLSGAQLNRVSYEFTGVLTGNRNIIVPSTVQQYWVFNNTTGAFTLTVKCTGGGDPGVIVPQGGRAILYSTGANIVTADTVTSSIPAVVQGDLLYGAAPGLLASLVKSTSVGKVLTNGGTTNNPSWGSPGLTGSITIDFPSIAAGTLITTPVVCSGASIGDPVAVGYNGGPAGLAPYAQVSSANTVSVGLFNYSTGAIDPASVTFKFTVFK